MCRGGGQLGVRALPQALLGGVPGQAAQRGASWAPDVASHGPAGHDASVPGPPHLSCTPPADPWAPLPAAGRVGLGITAFKKLCRWVGAGALAPGRLRERGGTARARGGRNKPFPTRRC